MIPRYGIEGVALVDEDQWKLDDDSVELVRASDGMRLTTFDQVYGLKQRWQKNLELYNL